MRFSFFTRFPLPLIDRLGRVGGVIAGLVAAIAAIGAVWMWRHVGPTDAPEVAALAVGLAAASPFVALQSLALLVLGRAPSPRLSDAELLERLASRERPLTVCLDCRGLCAVPPCEHCGKSAACLDIRTRGDVKNALRLLNLPAPPSIAAPPELDPDLRRFIWQATQETRRLQRPALGVEQVLLGLLQEPRCLAVLQACGAKVEPLAQRLTSFVESPGEPAPAGAEPQPTPELERVIADAAFHALSQGNDSVSCADALVAICQQDASQAQQWLVEAGATREAVLGAVARAR